MSAVEYYKEHYLSKLNKKLLRYGKEIRKDGKICNIDEAVLSVNDIEAIQDKLHSSVAKIHKNIFNNPSKLIFLEGGRGGAKTQSIIIDLIFSSFNLKYQHTDFFCFRKKQVSIGDSVKSTIESNIQKFDLLDCFKITNTEIINKYSKVTFKFKGYKDRSALLSLKSLDNVSLCFFEEAEEMTNEDIKIIIPTLRRFENHKLIFAYNRNLSIDPVDAFKRECVDKETNNTLHIYSTYLDNEFINQDMILEADKCKARNSLEYNHIWLGLPSGQYTAFSSLTKLNNGIDLKGKDLTSKYPWYISMDWGYSSLFCVGFYVVIDKTVVVKIDELTGRELSAVDVAYLIKQKTKYYNHSNFKFAVADTSIFSVDASGQAVNGCRCVADYFKKEGITFRRSNKTREVGFLRMKDLIETKQFLISIDCKEFWDTVPDLLISTKKKTDIDDDHKKQSVDHSYDETRYMLMALELEKIHKVYDVFTNKALV